MTTRDRRKSKTKAMPTTASPSGGESVAAESAGDKASMGAPAGDDVAQHMPGEGDPRLVPRRELVVFIASADDSDFAHVAAGWFRLLADPEKAIAVLATTSRLSGRAHPRVAAAMAERGARLDDLETRILTPSLLLDADIIVTIARSFDRVPLETHQSLYREHWQIDVGEGEGGAAQGGMGRARSVRELIRSRVAMLVFTEGWVRADIPREEAHVTRPPWHNEAHPAF